MRLLGVALLGFGAIGAGLAIWTVRGNAHASPLSCPPGGAVIIVDTQTHRLALCNRGVATSELGVALGRGGVDKHREGDHKTPLGEYALAEPRTSTRFHAFIPVGYPTPAQRAEGRSGGAIGIHGPSRRYRWLGRLHNAIDWTDGCIAVDSDEAIDSVVAWVRSTGVNRVVLR